MEYIWGYVLDATLYGSITGLVILFINFLFRKRINKKFAYLLWMILILKLMIPYGPQSSISLFNKIPLSVSDSTHLSSENKKLDTSKKNKSYEISEYDTTKSKENINTDIKDKSVRVNSSVYVLKKIIPFIWIGGAALILIFHSIIYLNFLRNIRKTSYEENEKLNKILIGCKEELHIKRKVEVITDNMVNSPSLIGVFKMRVVMPVNLIDLSEEELKHVFLHELCHYKNKDILVNNLMIFIQAIHWFNPVVWFLFKRVRNDMEMACDERVLNFLNEKDHNKYGLTMLSIIEEMSLKRKVAVGLKMADDKKTIRKRVELIKNSKHFNNKKKIFTVTGLICLLVLGGVLLTNEKNILAKNLNTTSILKSESKDLDKAISKVIKEKYGLGLFGMDLNGELSENGEFVGESHKILGKKESDKSVEVYLMTSYATYGFENDIFNLTSGSFNIPMRIKFSKVKNGEFLLADSGYYYIDSEEAEDGAQYEKSVKKMFPREEANKALSSNYTKVQQEDIHKQALDYVKNLGRDNKVVDEYLEKNYIDNIAFNDMIIKEKLWDYPTWIGTREACNKDGKWYKYETEYDKSSNIVTFTKYDDNKKQIENMQYKLKGDKYEKLNSK